MKILIVAGGTGGHIFPAISLANKIKQIKPSVEITFCIDERVDKKFLEKSNFAYYLLNAPRMPYKKYTFQWVTFFIELAFSFAEPARVLKEVDPDVVVGFGAYLSGPLLMEAKKLKKKIIIHEQNVVMGRANRLLSKRADKIAGSFQNAEYSNSPKFVLTGNPVREELLEDVEALDRSRALKLLDLDPDKKTVLITGGSLGSRIINRVFLHMLGDLSSTALNSLQIIHLTGREDFDNVQDKYKNIKVKVKVFPFYERMGLLYKAADFAITRAGAITISELCIFGVPAIIIPYAKAGAHQLYNAQFLKDRNAGLLIEEKQFIPQSLDAEFMFLLNNDEKRDELAKNAKSLAIIDAAEKLAWLVLEI